MYIYKNTHTMRKDVLKYLTSFYIGQYRAAVKFNKNT